MFGQLKISQRINYALWHFWIQKQASNNRSLWWTLSLCILENNTLLNVFKMVVLSPMYRISLACTWNKSVELVFLSGNRKYWGFPPLAATRRTRRFSNGNKANNPNEDGPNNLFERFELRDKSCDYYCCYCCVWRVKVSSARSRCSLLEKPSVKGTLRTSTDVVRGGVHHRMKTQHM